MAPVCSNCSGTDFVWANELKTGITGASLSLRARGEVPLGTRICRTCGHADLFLRDISILHQPHNWRPGEFVPIVAKPASKPAHAPHSPPPTEAPAPPPPQPITPPPPPREEPPAPPASEPEPAPAVATEPDSPPAAEEPAPAEAATPKPKAAKKRAPRSKP